MRHNRRTKRFARSFGERKAMLENLVSSLLTHQQITTTLPKAKEAKRLADQVITLGKTDSLHSRRMAYSVLQDHQLTSKLFKEVAPRFKDRKGGYTRILHLQRRKGDGAELALLELTEKEIKVKEIKKKEKPHKLQEQPPAAKKTGQPATGAKAHGKEETAPAKHPKPKGNFFKNLGKFFRNKGGG